jgi:hypothetical protein
LPAFLFIFVLVKNPQPPRECCPSKSKPMKQVYLLLTLLCWFGNLRAQDCSTLQISFTASESRCVATGSIQINATGGSGTYNYRVEGPVNPPQTSASLITGLQPGYYRILVKDLETGCQATVDSAFVPGTYLDPRFQLVKTDAGCAGNDGTISVVNQQNGRAPFTYTIIAPSPSSVGASNTTGSFGGLLPGEYAVQLEDSCGGIQVRRITIENYNYWLDSTSVVRLGCDSGRIYIRLKDNRGNVNTSGTAFANFMYGVVMPGGDTTWSNNYQFSFFLGRNRWFTILVRDACGNLNEVTWNLPNEQLPQVGGVNISAFTCNTFTATVAGQQNLTNPSFCLYNASNVQLSCNSTGVFPNLAFGDYCIRVTDPCFDTLIVRCFTITRPLPSVAPNVGISNQTCSTFTATITGQQNLVNPQYCLYDSTNTLVSCNTSGVFPNLPYASYCIRIANGCGDTTITRCFTPSRPPVTLTGYVISGISCGSFTVTTPGTGYNPQYCLYDSNGNLVTCNSTGIFTGLPHGSYCVRATACGDTTAPVCFTSYIPQPSIGTAVITNKTCNTFTASVPGQWNLVNPQFCLYNSADSLLACNSTGTFNNLAYGTYCIRMRDGCVDTTIVRCFTATPNTPTVNGTVNQTNSFCSTFTATVTGSNLTNPEYCVYDSQNNLISCNTTGVFNDLEYGTYCFTVYDGCRDTTLRVCRTFTRPRGLSLSSTKACTIGTSQVRIQFNSGNAPFNILVYHPNGALVKDTLSWNNPVTLLLPALPTGTQYRIIGIDDCNQRDTGYISPNATLVNKSVTVRSRCPGSVWPNGSGDMEVFCSSNHYTTTPSIIRKNGVPVTIGFSNVSGNNYSFADLEPATYVVAYTMQTCNVQLFDTVTVLPYAFPTQGQSAVYQCDNNSLSLGAAVQGGVGPYTYQIIGSQPSTPSITTAAQTSPVFQINTGTTYSLVRLRVVDACGNASLDDVSVLPLQNVSISATNECFYQDVLLTVDSIPNATYQWYHKTTPTDSVLVSTGTSHNMPFFLPEQQGLYVCKVNVNDGCLVRLTYFYLDGDCNTTLPTALQLIGEEGPTSHRLRWTGTDREVTAYVVERKGASENGYRPIGTVTATAGSRQYHFSDTEPPAGRAEYRLKLLHRNGRTTYSNSVVLNRRLQVSAAPNPLRDRLTITLPPATGGYAIEVADFTGRVHYSTTAPTGARSLVWHRPAGMVKGVYLLRVTSRFTGETVTLKLLVD